MKRNLHISITTAALPLLLLAIGSANAALVQNNASGNNSASGSDLLQMFGTPTGPSGISREGSGTDLNLLRDNIALFDVAANGSPNYDAAPGPGTISPLTLAPANGESMTFDLDTSTNSMGYDITQVDFYHGWGDNGRDGMRFEIEYSLVGDASFILYGSTTKFDPNPDYGLQSVTDSLGLIASGVDALRFTPQNIDNGFGGVSEIDVFGRPVATVPEPATATLAMLGLGGLVMRRRRNAA